MVPRCLIAAAAVVVALQAIPPSTSAKVFYARDEVQQLAFPGATRMEPLEFFLTVAQRETIERQSRALIDSDLVTVYAGYTADKLLGYAFIETRQVRTLPETFLVVLDRDGKVASTHVLAFYEPLEYLPPARWLTQYSGARLTNDLRVGDRIVGITGATLTAHAINGGIRRALAIHAALLAER